jgi:hypothetical protein
LKKAETRLKEEETRVDMYLDESTMKPVSWISKVADDGILIYSSWFALVKWFWSKTIKR